MSSGHRAPHKFTTKELDDLLDEAMAHPRIKARLAKPYKLVTSEDVALLGSSSIGGRHVYLDRHLKHANWPYGVIPVDSRRLDVKPGLIRHERLEQALEDELGWPYLPLAHNVAQHWENRLYAAKGFDPEKVEQAFKPFLKYDEHEKIVRSPVDLDMRPLLAPPRSDRLIDVVNAAAAKEKVAHAAVGYVEKSARRNQACGKCSMFVEEQYGGPACTLVKPVIVPGGWCRRFVAGRLAEGHGE